MPRRPIRQVPFNRITIIGVGLIGGSLALALKEKYPSIRVTGVDTPAVLKRALKRKAIDRGERSLERAVRYADLVVIATPVSVIGTLLPRIARAVSHRTVVTDTGSVKHVLVRQADSLFPHGNFIGGHPMTGSEYSGINAAHPLLFQNALYLLTPSRTSRRQLLGLLGRFISSLDARVLIIDASVHDSVVAAVSHLPQLAAVALMNTVGKRHAQARKHLALAAGGFRDMTRIASSPFGVWKDILHFNRKEIGASLRLYIQYLERLAADLKSDRRTLSTEFSTSRSLRSRIPQSMKGFLSTLVDVPIFIEDRPGELARLTGLLAKQKINIKDMELLKVREGRGGTFRLSFESRTVASEAARILKNGGFGVEGKW